ncbi:na[+]-dependent inorganic phosphate cotransporter [Calliopsis andreniformis]|uniref:na[+]-dependent inorganic phosphate cotransporter n=1 Tax=Calliopsis andreniformis TaxID=337506 RepID=UPI003FCC473B
MKNGPTVGQLTTEQREAYNNIKKWINNKRGTTTLVQTPSGTGKTFVLSVVAKVNNTSVDYLVFRKDQASQLSLDKIVSFTFVSYIMRHFGLEYQKATRMFSITGMKDIDILYWLIKYSLRHKNLTDRHTINTIILDTYTVSSPLMILLLYVLSLKNNINLIFAGNLLQVGAVYKSPLHNRNNFYIAEILSDQVIQNLTKNMRVRDNALMNKLSLFSEAIECYKSEGEVPFYFGLRYLLYCLFQPKYFTEERFDTLYISQYHLDITKRMYRFIDYLKSNSVRYVIEPYQYWNEKKYETIPMDSKDGKFLPGLLIANGYKYVYITREGIHRIVRVEEMIFSGNKLTTITICYLDDNRVEKIQRCCLNYYQILPAYRSWLTSKSMDGWILYHFPLRLYTLTYHAVLGQTIKAQSVEISANYSYPTSTANSIYVGLSCLTTESAIHKIHATQDLLSFVVTNYMEIERQDTEFYYRCPENDENRDEILKYISTKGINKCIDDIKWIDVDSIIRFESKKSIGHLRIRRSLYEQKTKKEKTTSLMKVAQFIKENKAVIRSAIDVARKEKVKVANTKKIPKPKSQDTETYIYLKNAYDKWNVQKEE